MKIYVLSEMDGPGYTVAFHGAYYTAAAADEKHWKLAKQRKKDRAHYTTADISIQYYLNSFSVDEVELEDL